MTPLKYLSEPLNRFVVAVISIYLEYLWSHPAVSIEFRLPGHLRGLSKSKPSRFGSILLLCVEERFGLAENKSNSFRDNDTYFE